MHVNAVGMKLTLENMPAGTFKANSSLMFIHHLEKYVHIQCIITSDSLKYRGL